MRLNSRNVAVRKDTVTMTTSSREGREGQQASLPQPVVQSGSRRRVVHTASYANFRTQNRDIKHTCSVAHAWPAACGATTGAPASIQPPTAPTPPPHPCSCPFLQISWVDESFTGPHPHTSQPICCHCFVAIWATAVSHSVLTTCHGSSTAQAVLSFRSVLLLLLLLLRPAPCLPAVPQ